MPSGELTHSVMLHGPLLIENSMRKVPTRQPLRSDAQRRLWRRMQNMHKTIHSLQMESGQNRSTKADGAVFDLC